MARIPNIEKPPGIKEPYLGMWRLALADLKDSGLWRGTVRPLLCEYIDCYRLAHEHRAIAETAVQTIHHRANKAAGEEAWDEVLPAGVRRSTESNLDSLHPGFASADREMKRAIALANELGLTPKARKALAVEAAEAPSEPSVIGRLDELAQARRRRSA
jgi:phage terminase small subunit